MNLRNGKITAVVKVTVFKEEKPLVVQEKDRVKDFTDELMAMFFEAQKYEESTLGRLCVYHEIYEVVDSSINEFKDVPRLAKLFATIRETSLRLVGEVARTAMKHGNEPEFLEATIGLSNVIMRVLAKLGTV
jgi:hypothetical protein